MSSERTYINDNEIIKKFLNKEVNILLKSIKPTGHESWVSGTLENVDEKYLLVKRADSSINSYYKQKDPKYYIIPQDNIYLIELN